MTPEQKATFGSLSGARVVHDLATGDKRTNEQEIYTPRSVIDVCLAVWPEGIRLDPCSGPDSIVPAEIRLQGRRVDSGRRTKHGATIWKWEGAGLRRTWCSRTYCNPPFNQLRQWLAHAVGSEVIVLAPVRSHRGWWRDWRDAQEAYCEMDPLKFLGYASSFPAPLILGYRGERVAQFKRAAAKLGSVYSKRTRPPSLVDEHAW